MNAGVKVGIGVPEILEAIVQRMPPPPDNVHKPLRALVFDSYYDAYRGVVVFIRVVDGALRRGDRVRHAHVHPAALAMSTSAITFTPRRAYIHTQVRFSASGMEHEVLDLGTLTPGGELPTEILRAGEVGYLHGGIKSVTDARVGDTITGRRDKGGELAEPLAGYREPVPVVYCGLFPVETTQYQLLRESLEKLCLNDAALCFEPESSSAMGFGFRCGFLGLLHMEIIQVPFLPCASHSTRSI